MEHRRKHCCVAVRGISSCEHECHPLASSASAEFRQPLQPGAEFAHVQAPELIEAIGIVLVPTAKGVAWSELARPIVYVSLVSSQPTGPETVDEQDNQRLDRQPHTLASAVCPLSHYHTELSSIVRATRERAACGCVEKLADYGCVSTNS
jgi:hypothetical protein